MLLHIHLSAQQVLRASNVTNSLLRFLGKLLTSTANARPPPPTPRRRPPGHTHSLVVRGRGRAAPVDLLDLLRRLVAGQPADGHLPLHLPHTGIHQEAALVGQAFEQVPGPLVGERQAGGEAYPGQDAARQQRLQLGASTGSAGSTGGTVGGRRYNCRQEVQLQAGGTVGGRGYSGRQEVQLETGTRQALGSVSAARLTLS